MAANFLSFSNAFSRMKENIYIYILIQISSKFVPTRPINNIPELVPARGQALSRPTMASLLTHICVTRLQWLNPESYCQSDNFLSFVWTCQENLIPLCNLEAHSTVLYATDTSRLTTHALTQPLTHRGPSQSTQDPACFPWRPNCSSVRTQWPQPTCTGPHLFSRTNSLSQCVLSSTLNRRYITLQPPVSSQNPNRAPDFWGIPKSITVPRRDTTIHAATKQGPSHQHFLIKFNAFI